MPVNPETQAPSRASQKAAKKRVKRATAAGTRTSTEVSQTTPTTAKTEKAKTAAVQAASSSKKKVRRKAAAKYAKTLDRVAKEAHQAAVHAKHVAKQTELESSGVSRTNFGQAVKERRVSELRPHKGDIAKLHETAPPLGELLKDLAIDVATTAGPAAAFKGVRAGQAILRGEKALGTAERAAKATKVAKEAKAARKAERAGARAKETSKLAKARATGRGMSAQAKKRLAKTEVKAAAKRSAHRTADRTLASNTAPVLAAGSAAPGDVGKRTRAFVEGSATADPIKSAHATLEAVPALFTAGASVAGGVYRSAKTGDPAYLGGALKALGEGAKDVVEPYVSGDPEKVKHATENTGYILAPLVPHELGSGYAKAAGRGAKKTAAKAAKPVTRRVRARRAASGRVGPSKTQRAGQIIRGGKVRKDVAKTFARHGQPALHKAQEDAFAIEKVANKAKGARGVRNWSGPEAGGAAAILARYGVGRKNTIRHAEQILKHVDNPRNEMVNLTNTVEWLRRNPDVVKDDKFWDTVAEFRKATEPLETSPRAKFAAQGDVAGVTRPEHDVPRAVKAELGDVTREEAWKIYGRNERKIAKLRGQGGNKALAQAKLLSLQNKRIFRELDPLSRPGESLEGKRTPWTREMQEDYVDAVRAGRHPDLEDPIWLSEKPIKTEPATGFGGSKVGLKQRVQGGGARKGDLVDRSLGAVLRNSIIDPHLMRGTARAIRATMARHNVLVAKGPKMVELAKEGKIDLTTHTPVPSRWWKAALEGEAFDAVQFHKEAGDMMRTDLAALEKDKGNTYALLPNEAAYEMVDQLAPEAGRWEKVIGTTAGIGSRVVLYSPAWVAAQIVNETSQLVADAGVRGTVGGAADLARMFVKDREGYRAALRVSGDPNPVAHPVAPRITADASYYADMGTAGRVLRKTAAGRFLYEAARLHTFSNIDRWKTTRLRAVALLAKNNKDFGRFTRGLGKTLDGQERISKKLSKMSRSERHKYVLDDPEGLLRQQLNHVDEMLGNWDAFTRYERTFGPLAAFYPYLRMSLQWTFKTYPAKHPIKAGILYVLAQQNHNQLEKLLGRSPSFLQSAYPALYNKEGKADAVMPGGARFGAPGSNVLVEAIGSGNIAGVSRLLNPVLSTGTLAFFGINAFTGEQEAKPGTAEWGMNALASLLGMLPPVRPSANKLRGHSEAAQVFQQLDPQRAMRSALNPFIPLSAERYRMQNTLSDALEAVSEKPEYGDLVDAILAKDRAKVRELAKKVDLAADAQKIIEQFLPSSKAEDKAVEKAGTISREGSKGLRGGSSTSSSSGGASWYDSLDSSGGSSKKSSSGWY